MRNTILSLTALLLFTPMFAQKATLESGWEAFMKNDLEKAEELFTTATADPGTKAEAYLSLSLLMWELEKDDKSFEYFNLFSSAETNNGPYMVALWHTPSVWNGGGKLDAAQLATLKKLMARKDLHGTLAAMANTVMGYHFESSNEWAKCNEQFKKMGALDKWQFVGTFDNYSGSGFNNDPVPLKNPSTSAVFKNKIGVDVSWFDVEHIRNDKWVDPTFNMSMDEAIMFAQTFVEMENATEGLLMSGVSGAVKIWVNDRLIITESEERNTDMDVYNAPVSLNKGFNRIVIQLGVSEVDRGNFMVRLTDQKGFPLPVKTVSSSEKSYNASSGSVPVRVEAYGMDFFKEKVRENPESVLYSFLLSQLYLRNDIKDEAHDLLESMRNKYPVSTFIAKRYIEILSREGNVTDLTAVHESIKKNDPECYYSLDALYDEADNSENHDLMKELAYKIQNRYGSNHQNDFRVLLADLPNQTQNNVSKSINEFYKKYPESYSGVMLKYYSVQEQTKNLAASNKILQAYLKKNYSDQIYNQVVNNLFKLGNGTLGLSMLETRIKQYPYKIGFINELAQIYSSAELNDRAIVWQERTMKCAPYEGYYCSLAAAIREDMGEATSALNLYKTALKLNPNDYDSRRKIRTLEGQKDLFDYMPKADVQEVFKNCDTADKHPDDHSYIALYDVQRVVYPEGPSEEKFDILIKIYKPSGIEAWKEYGIGVNGYSQRLIVDKAEVLKQNGNITMAEGSDNQIVFTGLEVGDAIHLSYRIENYRSGKLMNQFWDEFRLKYPYPIGVASYQLLVPANKDFKYVVRQSTQEPEITAPDSQFKLYKWEAKNLEATKYEDFQPSLSDVVPVLEVSSVKSWDDIANWYKELAGPKTKADYTVKKTVQEILKGNESKSEMEKVKLFYNYLEKNMTYSNVSFMHGPIIPQKASRTLTTKLGDCKDMSTLFVSMCQEAGIKANLVLVNTRDNGENTMALPSIEFNHCIAQIEIGGQKRQIELTDKFLSFGTLPAVDLNAQSLVIPNEGESTGVKLTPLNNAFRPKNDIIRKSTLVVSGRDLQITRNTTKTGTYAASMRETYADLSEADRKKEMSQAVSNGHVGNVVLNSLQLNNLETLGDSVVYSYSYTASNEANEVAGLLIFEIPWSEKANSLTFLNKEKRENPLDLWRYSSTETEYEEFVINIPSGKVLAETPKNLKVSSKVAEYSVTYKVEPTKITATRTFKITKDRLSPAEYQEVKDFYFKVNEQDKKQLAFKAKAAK